MRLIDVVRFETDGDIHLKQFHKPPIGEYAILSHTWGVGEDDEVSKSDLKKPQEAAKKSGFAKIKYTCNQALEDGYPYVWIDTCCIDKENSSELTEAINSMYKWYELAAICYVYLDDLPGDCPSLVESRTHEVIAKDYDTRVTEPNTSKGPGKTYRPIPVQSSLPPPMDDEEEPGLHQKGWVSLLSGCRWFSRGWTLQELIAPKKLVFFGTGWNFIGSRLDLLYTLSDITGIDSIALSHRCKLQELSIAKRLSWAACRHTTHVEDTAYSLLGLLDINMPLLYGEGEKAFIRLQEEIIRRSADSSIFAWFRNWENGLLASSPGDFRLSGKVILRHGATIDHSFELTHRGLKMKLPILKRGWSGTDKKFLAVLSCRMEDDFERVLCLHLRKQMPDPTDPGETIVCSIEKCTPKCANFHAQDWNATRLHWVDSKKVRFAEYRTVLIPRHNFQIDASLSVLRMTSSLWIKKLPPSLQVVEVFPEHQWNIETRVMSKYRDLGRNDFTQCGGVLLKHTLDKTIAVCFFIQPGRAFLKVLNGSKMPLQKICKDLESKALSSQIMQQRAMHQFRALPSNSLVRLQATLEMDMCSDENVWCIELSQVDTDILLDKRRGKKRGEDHVRVERRELCATVRVNI